MSKITFYSPDDLSTLLASDLLKELGCTEVATVSDSPTGCQVALFKDATGNPVVAPQGKKVYVLGLDQTKEGPFAAKFRQATVEGDTATWPAGSKRFTITAQAYQSINGSLPQTQVTQAPQETPTKTPDKKTLRVVEPEFTTKEAALAHLKQSGFLVTQDAVIEIEDQLYYQDSFIYSEGDRNKLIDAIKDQLRSEIIAKGEIGEMCLKYIEAKTTEIEAKGLKSDWTTSARISAEIGSAAIIFGLITGIFEDASHVIDIAKGRNSLYYQQALYRETRGLSSSMGLTCGPLGQALTQDASNELRNPISRMMIRNLLGLTGAAGTFIGLEMLFTDPPEEIKIKGKQPKIPAFCQVDSQSSAETSNLQKLSDEELVALHAQINDTLTTKLEPQTETASKEMLEAQQELIRKGIVKIDKSETSGFFGKIISLAEEMGLGPEHLVALGIAFGPGTKFVASRYHHFKPWRQVINRGLDNLQEQAKADARSFVAQKAKTGELALCSPDVEREAVVKALIAAEETKAAQATAPEKTPKAAPQAARQALDDLMMGEVSTDVLPQAKALATPAESPVAPGIIAPTAISAIPVVPVPPSINLQPVARAVTAFFRPPPVLVPARVGR